MDFMEIGMDYQLSAYEKEFFNANGYIVLSNIITETEVEDTVKEIFNFVEFDINDIESCYSEETRSRSGIDVRGMVPFYHGQCLWNNRQNPSIYAAFRELLGEYNLMVSIDRVNINPPRRVGWDYSGFIHFDVDTTQKPISFELQGILGLSDYRPSGGGFKCLPGFHKHVDYWAANRRPGADPRFPDPGEFELTEIPFGKGDLLIFDGRLPHGNSENLSDTVRIAQYITMWGKRESVDCAISRSACIEMKCPPETRAGKLLPRSPKSEDISRKVQLTELGRFLNNIDE